MSTWAQQLDDVLPEPGIDLTFLDDPIESGLIAVDAMTRAADRLHATADDLDLVLEVLFSRIEP